MTNYEGNFTTGIFLHGEEINEVKTFKYLGSIIDDKYIDAQRMKLFQEYHKPHQY